MSILENFAQGFIAGTGMFVASAIFGWLAFKIMKPFITKTISEIWQQVKQQGLEFEVKIDGKKKKQ